MSFLQWLRDCARDQTAVGDFARDALQDPTFPTRATSWVEVETYLWEHSACAGAINAGKSAWDLFSLVKP